MKKSKAFRKAWAVYLGHPAASLKFLLVELCLTLMALLPLLFLAEPSLRLLAGLTPVTWVLLALPVRFNAAGAMQAAMAGDSLFSMRVADPTAYGKKLAYGLGRCALLLMWGAPLIACVVIARMHISGEMDGFTLMRLIKEFGGGDLMQGVTWLALILTGAILLLMMGIGFHSGDRHAAALGRPSLMKNRRWRMLGCWCCSLLVLLPMLAAIAGAVIRYAPVLADLNGLLMGTVELPDTRTTLIMLGVGAVLTIPLLPLRSLMLAARVDAWRREDESTAG